VRAVKVGATGNSASRGFKSDALKHALDAALLGRFEALETLLSRHGNLPAPRPNLELAAAFGVELASQPGDVTPLLERLAHHDAAPDTAEVFLPIAAAHGWVALIHARRDVEVAWAALPDLLADEREPVRLGMHDALVQLCAQPGHSDRFVARGLHWLAMESPEARFGVAASVCEILTEKTVSSRLLDGAALREYLSAVLADASDAPRTASRMDTYRRVLAALPRALAAAVALAGSGGREAEETRAWLAEECSRAHHPPVRDALAAAISELRIPGYGQGAGIVTVLRAALKASAKPPRDPTRIRPGLGRGKRSRPIR
jgi:hypothetical protein